MTRPIPIAAVFRAIVLVQLAALTASPASAMIITVGQAGIPGNCTKPTLAEALQKASATPEPTRYGSPRRAARHVRQPASLINNLDVDIIGGFADCWSPSPTGRSRFRQVISPASMLEIRGGGVIT